MMFLNGLFDYRQSQPCPICSGCKKWLENLFLFALINPWTIVTIEISIASQSLGFFSHGL